MAVTVAALAWIGKELGAYWAWIWPHILRWSARRRAAASPAETAGQVEHLVTAIAGLPGTLSKFVRVVGYAFPAVVASVIPRTRYAAPTEHPVVATRRHWAILVRAQLPSITLLFLAVLVHRTAGPGPLRTWMTVLIVFVVARAALIFLDWTTERLVVTNQRLFLVTGLFIRKTASLPLSDITEISWRQSTIGRVLGYGEWDLPTLPSDHALRRILYIPRAGQLRNLLPGDADTNDLAPQSNSARPSLTRPA